MAESFAAWPEAIPTTLEIAERCDLEIELGQMLLPRYPAPDGEEPSSYLRRLTEDGLRQPLRRSGARSGGRAARDRAERDSRHGLRVVLPDRLGLRQVREGQRHRRRARSRFGRRLDRQLLASTSRTSIRSPTTCMFERFLNAERRSMPDIDIDFSVKGRERVIRYVQQKYGADAVAQIITFGKMAPRAATPRRGPRPRQGLCVGRPHREADPGAGDGPQSDLRGLPRCRFRAAAGLRLRSAGEGDHRRRTRPRGHRPQQLDPRSRRRDCRPAADGDRPAPARRGTRPGRVAANGGTNGTATASPSAPTRR